MSNCLLAILAASAGGVYYVSPLTLALVCIIVAPAAVALAVFSYVSSRKEDDDVADEEGAEEEEEEEEETRSMSTRRWYAERFVPCALEGALRDSIPLRAFSSSSSGGGGGGTMMKTEMSSCVVCLTPFQVQELLKVLPPCHHPFHVACIDRWFESHSTCPICRCQVRAPDQHIVCVDVLACT